MGRDLRGHLGAAGNTPQAGTELLRPLSHLAQNVLQRTLHLDCPYVFSTDGKPIAGFGKMKVGFDTAVLAKLRKSDSQAKALTNWTLHDLRRTARSLMSRAGVLSDHAERCLGHVIGGVRGVYDRYEFYQEKVQAYESLAALIKQICA